MDTNKRSIRRTLLLSGSSVFMAVTLSGCFDDGGSQPPDPMPTMTPAPTPTPTQTSYDVTACLQQEVAPGVAVADLIVPDTLTLDLSGTSGFPNGRKLSDPVIDVTLAVIFLDLGTHSATTLAGLPLNPPSNDVAFQSSFPFLAPAQGSPPVTTATGTTFTFRSSSPDQYTRVDRMGMPAVSTALIGSDTKVAYNDADPADDASGTFVPELTEQLTGLTNALADDLTAAGLKPCATAS